MVHIQKNTYQFTGVLLGHRPHIVHRWDDRPLLIKTKYPSRCGVQPRRRAW